jgi:outer membrane protein TolC
MFGEHETDNPNLPPGRGVQFLFAAALVTSTAGCAINADSIDRRVAKLIETNSQRMGKDTAAPAPNPGVVPARSASSFTRQPPTTNPDAAAIRYTPADESRDVIARLRRYADQYGVMEATQPPDENAPPATPPEGTTLLTLDGALGLAQRSGRELLSAQEEYILAAIRVLVERHLWGPRFFNDTSATLSGDGDAGSFGSALSVVNTLRAAQRLPSGGQVEAQWLVRATDQLRRISGEKYRQSSEIALSADIPLMRGAGDAAREDQIQAERDLIYAARNFERFRREFLVQIASDYFDLVRTRDGIRNQRRSLESVKTLEQSVRSRVEAGRLQAFEVDIAASRVASAEASLLSSLDGFILQLERFRIRLGLETDGQLWLSDDAISLDEPDIDEDEAGRLALEYRLDLQNERDRLDDARRGVRIAQQNLLPDLNLSGRVGVPTDPDRVRGGLNLSADDLNYSAGLTLSLPLDREVERLNLRSSLIALQRSERTYEQNRDNVVVGARSALRAVDLARRQLQLAEQQVEINRRRLRSQELQRDVVSTQSIIDTENDLLAAENERDRSRTALRTSVLRYLLETDQLRVDDQGRLLKLGPR